jgi:predicted unusual protein kinase regulating ubiquinone biosynthesis (AarF/ABC1/UbiB family)
MAAVIEAELGWPIDVAYRWFEPEPIAAASIGQVYRATLADGTAVAVKVQCPDVAEAVRADLANTAQLARSLRLLVPGLDAAGIAAEFKLRMLEELDYQAEARSQAAFSERYAGHPFIAIPRVVLSHSTGRVLTTEYAAGRNFAEVLRDSEPLRSRHAEILFRFLLASVLGHGIFNADPHPGNYRFDLAGERDTCLDFGCVKTLPTPVHAALGELFRGALVGNHGLVGAAAARLGVVGRGLRGQAVANALSDLYVPFTRDVSTSFPPPFSGTAIRNAARVGFGEIRRDLHVPAEVSLLNRTVVGLYAVLAQVGGTANWYRIAREYTCGDPPSTELGEAERNWALGRFPASA